MSPPLVTKVRIGNFRALRDLTLTKMKPLTVLVGPNGSGKSTVFDVFAFLSDCFTDGVHRACDGRGGLANIRSRGSTGPVAVELTYREQRQGRPRTLTYRLAIDDEGGRPYVADETLRWTTAPAQGRPRNILAFTRGTGQVWDEDTGRASVQTLADDAVLAVNALGQFKDHPRVEALRAFVSGWHLSYLTVASQRSSPPAGPQERLSKSGDNLSNVLQYLHERHPRRLEAIVAALREAIPALASVSYQKTADGRLVLLLTDRPFEDPILARFASDGTLKMLTYLVLLQDPDPSPFIGIEEPENFLYPTLLAGLADACVHASERSQVLVTTHSAEFVNACDPSQVLALYRDVDGYTRVVRPDDLPQVRVMMRRGADLGWLWQENYFEPLPTPRTPAREDD